MGDVFLAQQGICVRQGTNHGNIRLPRLAFGRIDIQPFKSFDARQIAAIVIDRRLELHLILATKIVIVLAVSRRDMHKAGTRIRRDEIAMIQRHIIVEIAF